MKLLPVTCFRFPGIQIHQEPLVTGIRYPVTVTQFSLHITHSYCSLIPNTVRIEIVQFK